MTQARDPVRLRDAHSQSDPELRRLLDVARTGAPSEARLNALQQAILQQAAAEAAVSDSRKSRPTARKGPALWKLLVILSLGGGGAALWHARKPPDVKNMEAIATHGAPEPVRPGRAVSENEAAAVSGEPFEENAAAAAATTAVSAQAEEVSARDRTRPAALSGAERSSVSRSVRRPRGRVEASPQAMERAAGKPDVSQSSADSATAIATASQTERRAAPKQTDVPPELDLLAQAQRALRSHPALAVRLANQHRAAYPSGAFVEEREAIAVEGLVAAGQGTAAHARGLAFLREYPSSTYAVRIATMIQEEH